MMLLLRFLWIALALELVAYLGLGVAALMRPSPPHPNLERQPASIVADLRRLEEATRSDQPGTWREFGEALMAFGYFMDAEACFRRGVQLDPKDFGLQYGLAYCLDRVGRLKESNKQFETAAKLASQELARTCWYHVGRNLMREEQVQAAEATFRRIEGFAAADYYRGRLLIEQKRLDELPPIFERLNQAVPNSLHVQMLAMLAARASNSPQAEEFHTRLAERGSDSLALADHWDYMEPIRTRYGVGVSLEQMNLAADSGDWRKAAQIFEAVIRTNEPDQTVFMLVQGADMKLQAGDAVGAQQVLESLERLRAPTPDALHFLGLALNNQGQLSGARTVWERSVQMRPSAATYERLADLLESSDDAKAANQFRALASQVSGIEAFRANKLDIARSELEKSVTLADDQHRTWYYLGEALDALGERGMAADAFRRCLDLNPQHGRAQRRLRAFSPAN